MFYYYRMLHLRVHTQYLGEIPKFIDFLKTKTDLHLVVRENGSKEKREHLHTLLTPKKTLSTFRQQLLKEYPLVKGNGAYSLELVKNEESIVRYCCKGEDNKMPDVIFNSSIDIENEHKLYWEKNTELKQVSGVNMGCQNGSPKKVKVPTWTERVYNEIMEQFEPQVNTIIAYQDLYKPTENEVKIMLESKKVIFRYFMKCMGKSVKKLDDVIIRQMFNGIINAIIQSNEEAGNKYADKMFDKIYQQY